MEEELSLPTEKKKLPWSCRIQRFLVLLGIAVHNPYRDECTPDFACCTKGSLCGNKYWWRINRGKISKIKKPKENMHDYASNYSRMVWEDLMKQFEDIPDFYIGCNDVSDIVMNAILNALKGQKYPKRYKSENEPTSFSDGEVTVVF